MKADNICYKITVEVARYERVVGGRQWVKGGDPEKPDEYGYSPNVMEVRKIDRKLLEITVDKLDMPELTKAVLKHSEPLI